MRKERDWVYDKRYIQMYQWLFVTQILRKGERSRNSEQKTFTEMTSTQQL